MNIPYDNQIRMIPVRLINVLNHRDRGKKKFAQIAANIAHIGLKRPVTLALAEQVSGEEQRFNLACGEGRLTAFTSLGQEEIPAIIVDASKETLHLMSLAENLARRNQSAVELVRDIRRLKDQKYTLAEIARKVDFDVSYVRGILQLLDRGEDRLLQSVERGHLPVSIAIAIATSDDKAIQKALEEAYEHKSLRGRAFLRAKRLIAERRARGKKPRCGPHKNNGKPVSTEALLKAFQEETLKQKMMIQKSKICETRLLFAVSALKQLFQDDHFVTLLRAEGLDLLPRFLADQIYEVKQ